MSWEAAPWQVNVDVAFQAYLSKVVPEIDEVLPLHLACNLASIVLQCPVQSVVGLVRATMGTSLVALTLH